METPQNLVPDASPARVPLGDLERQYDPFMRWNALRSSSEQPGSDAAAQPPQNKPIAPSAEIVPGTVYLETSDLGKDTLDNLLDALELCARPHWKGGRTLIWPFERTGATGHMAMEPFYLKSLFAGQFDQVIVVTRQRHSTHNSSTEIFDTALAGLSVACTDDPRLLGISSHEIGIIQRGPFVFFLHSYAHISRVFFQHCCAGGRQAFYQLSDEQEARGRKAFAELGIPADAKWVVAHARESGFHPRTVDNHRCASIESYFDSIRFLVDQGYYVIRIGDRSMKRLPYFGRQVIDAPFLANYSFILDVFAIAHCEFMISSHSGPCMLARAFQRPCLAVNVFPMFGHIPGERDMLALRRFYHQDNSTATPRALSYLECLERSVHLIGMQRVMGERGILYQELNSPEVLAITQEMLRRVRTPSLPPTSVHEIFMAVNQLTNERARIDTALQRMRYDWYGLAKPGCMIPDVYCEIVKGFL